MSGVDDGRLRVRAGEVMGVAGATGAGKSALIDILAARMASEAGGIVRVIRDPAAVALPLSVAENVFVGIEPRNRFGLVDRREMGRRTRDVFTGMGLRIDPWLPVERLSPAFRCAVQIAGALAAGASVIALDGLSAVLPENEVKRLFPVVDKLAEAGVGVLYASRCVRELYQICDRITVVTEGRGAGTFIVGEVDPAQVVDRMLTADQELSFARKGAHVDSEPVFEVRGLRSGPDVLDVSFSVSGGEIVALVGGGRITAGRALFGAAPCDAGEILLHGKPLRLRDPGDAVRAGIGYLAGDQMASGLAAGHTVGGSLSMLAPSLGWARRRVQRRLTANTQALLGIHVPGADVRVDKLSIEDQRRLSLAKWLAAESEVLILDEPGQGQLVRTLAAAGVAVVVISSDITEVLQLADRVVVLQAGRVVRQLSAAEATRDDVVNLVTGQKAAS